VPTRRALLSGLTAVVAALAGCAGSRPADGSTPVGSAEPTRTTTPTDDCETPTPTPTPTGDGVAPADELAIRNERRTPVAVTVRTGVDDGEPYLTRSTTLPPGGSLVLGDAFPDGDRSLVLDAEGARLETADVGAVGAESVAIVTLDADGATVATLFVSLPPTPTPCPR
jgi:hypothetical protein